MNALRAGHRGGRGVAAGRVSEEGRGSKGSYNSPETVVTDTCESPLGPLEGQAVLVTAESSLSIPHSKDQCKATLTRAAQRKSYS